MRKVFWDNPYQCNLTTEIQEVRQHKLLFAETIAFSFSGGQESDKAFVNDLPILNSEIVGQSIYYTLPADHSFKVGDKVTMRIDWPRRLRLMRLHFAAELVLEIISQKLNWQKIGAHIAEDKARIDFVATENISSNFPDVLAAYDEIIASDTPICTGYTDVAAGRRYWELKGFAKVACGGTHVRSTGEVGAVQLKRVNIGGGKERVEIRLLNGI